MSMVDGALSVVDATSTMDNGAMSVGDASSTMDITAMSMDNAASHAGDGPSTVDDAASSSRSGAENRGIRGPSAPLPIAHCQGHTLGPGWAMGTGQ